MQARMGTFVAFRAKESDGEGTIRLETKLDAHEYITWE
jgi:hypothetical protein